MTLRLQLIVIICMVIAIAYIVYLTSKKKIDFKYALVWILVASVILILTVFPVLLVTVTGLFGIATPVNMLFFLGFIFVLIIIFTLSRTVSELSDKVKKISQELAILRKDALHKETDSNADEKSHS